MEASRARGAGRGGESWSDLAWMGLPLPGVGGAPSSGPGGGKGPRGAEKGVLAGPAVVELPWDAEGQLPRVEP